MVMVTGLVFHSFATLIPLIISRVYASMYPTVPVLGRVGDSAEKNRVYKSTLTSIKKIDNCKQNKIDDATTRDRSVRDHDID